MLVVIDNFDSFTYNLVQYLGELGADIRVYRNNAITVGELRALKPSHIVISPGPGRPEDAGISPTVIKELHPEFPILGVCLGHQAIGQVFGATVTYAPSLMHGKTSPVIHNGTGVFKNLPSPLTATRYHSLVVDEATLPAELVKTAWTQDGVLMGISHRNFPLHGIQFHPESILTEHGKDMLKNFLEI
ncbi:MAG: aminodeoxychorismate/anthranilate synthase component II [Candidatus Margulisiibacteriota bacterium]